ncbi:MAG: LamG domain-containing protein [Candidatus Poribacteria bacterium]
MRRELPLVSRLRRGIASIALGLGIGCALAVAPVVEARDVEGLVVYFPFDEGAGGSVTDPRGGHVGSIIGDAAWGKGKYGGGLDFGGADGYVRVPHHGDFDFTEGITIAAWIRPTLAVGPGIWQIIAAKGQDASEFFEILINPAGLVWMGWLLSDARIVPDQSPKLILPKAWQHVAVSYQKGEWWNVYLNGELLIEHQDQDLVPNTDDLLVGVEEPLALQRFYNGEMDEFVLYDRGLTQDEVQEVQAGVETLLAVDARGMHSARWGALKARYAR